jgi:diacylglycerol kinase family enzyme
VGFIPLFAKKLPEGTTLRVYAVGGDGILFDCLNGMIRLENAELAAIPYGYTNNFVRGFDKSEKIYFRHLAQQYTAPTIPMDVIRCGSQYALNYCIIGSEAEAIYRAEKEREQWMEGQPFSRWLCRQLYSLFYITNGIAACSQRKFMLQKYDIEIDGEKISGAIQSLSVFNGPYYGGNWHPVSKAMPNDGILDMLVIRNHGPLQALFLLPFYISDHYKMFFRNLTLKQGRKISIRSEDILRICMDGIIFFESEFEMELLPAAIKFVDASRYGYKGVQA